MLEPIRRLPALTGCTLIAIVGLVGWAVAGEGARSKPPRVPAHAVAATKGLSVYQAAVAAAVKQASGYPSAPAAWSKCPDEKPWILGKRKLPLASKWWPETPVWDPTGENLVFCYFLGPKFADYASSIWACDRWGLHARPVLFTNDYSEPNTMNFAWTPDGRNGTVAFWRDVPPDQSFWFITYCVQFNFPKEAGETLTPNLVIPPPDDIASLQWKPNEPEPLHLLINTRRWRDKPDSGGKYSRIHIINVQTKEDRILPLPETNIFRALWMPDGIHILYVAASEENPMIDELFIVRSDGLQRRQLTRNQGVTKEGITVSPSGKSILFCCEMRSGVKILDVKTGRIRQFINAWVENIAWSSQNELAARVIKRDDSDIVVYKIKPNVF